MIMFKTILRYHQIAILLATFGLVTLTGCEKEPQVPYDPIPDYVRADFEARYPGATLQSNHYGEDYDGWAELEFIDSDGLEAKAHYKDKVWMMTNKMYSTDDFLFQLPRKVARAYLSTGVENEDYSETGSWPGSYVIETSRRGIDHKQFEFRFDVPLKDTQGVSSDGIVHRTEYIVISENGTLLYDSHGGSINPSFTWRDISQSLDAVKARYPYAEILGAVNESGDNLVFILDSGIIKTARSRQGRGWAWTETRHKLDPDTPLSESATKVKEDFLSENDGFRFTSLYSIETPEGEFLGLGFEKGQWDYESFTLWESTILFTPIR